MNLTIDIGNTRAKTGVFKEGQLLRTDTWEQWSFADFLAYAANHSAQNVILSTVAGSFSAEERQELQRRFTYVELQSDTLLPIENRYRSPNTLGKDRIAAVVGAHFLYAGQACLVVDAGTCITYDFLDQHGCYVGGNIAPGLRMRLRAMHAFTAGLPQEEVEETVDWIGDTTATALRNGAQTGVLLELEGYQRWGNSRFGPLQPLLTGGDAVFLANSAKSKIFVHHHLVLIGLNQILDYNVKRLE
ncbi:MAG: type III pantothenate kinase [Bacteroidetes bacterium]|nr:type III pantothenate kinase [Bacteroidota bacterium]